MHSSQHQRVITGVPRKVFKMRPSRLRELAAEISSQADRIEQLLESTGQPTLSLDLNAAPALPPPTHSAQQALLEATDELQSLVQGPMQSLMYLTGLTVRIPKIKTSSTLLTRFSFPPGSRST